MIDLFTAATPNGYKVSIALEEMEMPYNVRSISLSDGEQKTPAFLKINPNGRIPAIVDREYDNFTVFESGAILLYLAEKCGKFMPTRSAARHEAMQWLMYQMSAFGPMQGQAHVFIHYFPEQIPSVRNRYVNETRRLYEVLDERLADREFVLGEYSIVDMAFWPWVRRYDWAEIDIDDMPNLRRWIDAIAARPAAARGLLVPPSESAEQKITTGRSMVMQ